jgi:hypothetical protein
VTRRPRRHRRGARAPLAAALVAALAAPPAAAFDRFEIQVYEPEINEPGQVGLEVHTNFTASGSRERSPTGVIPPDHTGRMTFEPALGVTPWLELGAYLQTFMAPASGVRFGGTKLRAKLVAPPPLGEHTFLGLNVEVGRVPSTVDEAGWANEFRPFLGWSDGLWLVDANPIFGYTLSGKDKFRVDLEPAAKVALNTQLGFAVGAEWYADLGFVDAILRLRDQAHYLFGVVDVVPARGRPASPWEVNLAVGAGIGHAADQHLIVKTIVGRSF